MSKPGPAPKPTALKIIQGNPGRRPINKREPLPDNTKPRAPRWLRDAGRKEWDRLAKRLHRVGLLSYVDGAMLAAYCHAYYRYLQADEMIEKSGGQVITRPTGVMVVNPYVKAAQTWLDQAVKIGARFGLTPADRSRLTFDLPADQEETIEETLANLFMPVEE